MFLLTVVLGLNILLGQCIVGLTVTSSTDIETFVKVDFASNLEDYIKHEEFRLRVISKFNDSQDEVPLVKKKLEELKIIYADLQKNKTSNKVLMESAMDNHPTSVFGVIRDFDYHWHEKLANKTAYGHLLMESAMDNHPTSVFGVIRDFDYHWHEKLANKTAYGHRLKEFLTKKSKESLPGIEDFYRSGAVITFLQRVYNLSKADIVQGRIKGHQGRPLNAADCYRIGKVSAEAKMADDTLEWIEMALNSTDLTSNDVQKTAIFNVTDAIVLMAKALFAKERQEEAVAILERATEIDPDNMGVHNMYLTYRFGRKVKSIAPMRVEPARLRFFETCGNLSAGNNIGNKDHPGQQNLHCRYKSYSKTPYWRFQEEVISHYPFVSLIYDFLGPKKIELVVNVSKYRPFKEDPLPGGKAGQMWQSKIRVMPDFFHTVLDDVSKRVSYVSGLGVRQLKGRITLGEPIHVIDFGPGGIYLPHRDIDKQYYRHYIGMTNRTRLSTFHLFMDDTKEGGYLVFPELNITITPKQGLAVLVHNYKPNGNPEKDLLVGICPVLMGRSMVLQKGIFSSGLDQNVLCGKKPRSTHFNVEKARRCIAGPCGAPNIYTKS